MFAKTFPSPWPSSCPAQPAAGPGDTAGRPWGEGKAGISASPNYLNAPSRKGVCVCKIKVRNSSLCNLFPQLNIPKSINKV